MADAAVDPSQIPICKQCGTVNDVGAKTCAGCGEPVAPPGVDPLIGQLFANKYEIEKQLGQGGMGTVYLARQQPIERLCVLKVINAGLLTDPIALRRFQQEAEMCAKIYHPNAVAIYDFDQNSDGLAFIAMELVHGKPLEKIIANDFPFETDRIVRIIAQVCDVLAVGHQLKVIHRDLKPDNIMVGDLPTQKDFVKLLDFGLAKSAEQKEGATQLTMAGSALGTPEYMAPEQCKGEPIGAFTDIYALGAILYYMIAGVRPFEADSPAAYLAKHIMEEPVPPSRRARATVHPELEKLALWGLKKKPNERPPSTLEFKRALEKALPQGGGGKSTDALGSLRGLLGDIGGLVGGGGGETKEVVLCFVDVIPPTGVTGADAVRTFMAKVVDTASGPTSQPGQAEVIGTQRLRVGFGLTRATGQEPQAALACARAILKLAPQSSVCLHLGSVELSQDKITGGEACDLAERIALFAAAEQILATPAFVERSVGIKMRQTTVFELKGHHTPMSLFEPVEMAAAEGEKAKHVAQPKAQAGVVAVAAPVAAPADTKSWATVGLDATLTSLRGAAAQLAPGKGKGVLVCGASGLGKSRFIAELATTPKVRWLTVHCRDRKALVSLAQEFRDVPVRSENELFVRWLTGKSKDAPAIGPDELGRGVVAAIRNQVEAAAKAAPLGLLFDDVHLAEPLLRLVLKELGGDAVRFGVLLVLTSQPLPQTPPEMERVDLAPLPEALALQLATSIGGAAASDLKQVIAAAGGIPFAIVQLARGLRDGLISKEVLAKGGGQELLRPVYEARIDAASPSLRQALWTAAAMGEMVPVAVLREVTQRLGGADGVEALATGGLLAKVDDATWQFSTTLERQVAYSRLPAEKRATVHRTIAQAMESSGLELETIAAQYQAAGDTQAALEKLRQGGNSWLDRKNRASAINCFREACKLAANIKTERKRFAEDALALGQLLIASGAVGEAVKVLEAAEKAATEAQDKRLTAQIASEVVRLMLERSEFAAADKRLMELVQVGKDLRDPGLLSDLMGLAGESAERSGRADEAIKRVTQALELAARLDGEAGTTRAVAHLGRLGRIQLRAKQLDKALAVFRQQREAARQTQNPMEEAKALINEAAVLHGLQKVDECLTKLDDGLKIARDIGDLLTVAKALHNSACIRTQKGEQGQDTKKLFQESMELAQSIGWREGIAMNHTWLRKLAGAKA